MENVRISELAKASGVSVRSLRYYEQKDLLQSTRQENGYREFDESAVERVRAIQLYFGLGLNTDDIRDIFSCTVGDTMLETGYLCEGALHLYEEKLKEVIKQIDKLQDLKERLEERIGEIDRLNRVARQS